MSETLVLTYFDFAAVGEPLRLALALSGLDWEDKRLSKEQFMAAKPTLPYNQVPILEVKGQVIPQSLAQLRYIGKVGGLYPTDPIQAAYADAAADAVTDMHYYLRETMLEADAAKKLELRKEMATGFLPTWLANLEKALKAAGGKHFTGDKISIGDIAVVARLNWLKEGSLDGIPATIVDDFPLLLALVDCVMSDPKVVAYTESRAK